MKSIAGLYLGTPVLLSNYTNTVALSSATTFVSSSFTAGELGQLDGFYVFGTFAGTNGNVAIQFDLCVDSEGYPGTVLETVTVTGGWVSGALAVRYVSVSWATFLSINTRYHIVARNVSAAPATDYFTIRHVSLSGTIALGQGAIAPNTWIKHHSTDSGATWLVNQVDCSCFVYKFKSGTLYGPMWTGDSVAQFYLRSYGGTLQTGLEFTTPADVRAIGAQLAVRAGGTPVGPYRIDVYINRILHKHLELVNGVITSAMTWRMNVLFDTPIDIVKGSQVTIAFNQSGGDSSNYTYLNNVTCIPDIDEFKQLVPMSAHTVTINNGTWTVDKLKIPSGGLILDWEAPVLPPPINRRNSMLMR